MQPNQKGIIMSSSDLAIQGISRNQAGNYSCTASNVEGDGDSNLVHLKVMCMYDSYHKYNEWSDLKRIVTNVYDVVNKIAFFFHRSKAVSNN